MSRAAGTEFCCQGTRFRITAFRMRNSLRMAAASSWVGLVDTTKCGKGTAGVAGRAHCGGDSTGTVVVWPACREPLPSGPAAGVSFSEGTLYTCVPGRVERILYFAGAAVERIVVLGSGTHCCANRTCHLGHCGHTWTGRMDPQRPAQRSSETECDCPACQSAARRSRIPLWHNADPFRISGRQSLDCARLRADTVAGGGLGTQSLRDWTV